ncbi:MAG: threonine/serine exporter family protein [Acidipropionibacterium sp.]|nr:threonine/serine exporter family protein [Acidipropionibacterium sp.]
MADAVENIGLVARLGAALISANAPTTAVERAVAHLTERFGISASVTVLPNSVLAVETSKGITELGTARPGSYRFDQIDELFSLVEDLVAGEVSPHEAAQRLDALERSQPLIGTGVRYLGFLLIILGLGLNQRPTVPDLLVAMVLGLIIAVVLVTMPKWGRLSIVAPIAVSFISTLGILIATNAGIVTEPTKVLIPLVASLIPGAPLAISSLELAQGAIVSGSSRLAVAVHQLVVLALGVALAMSLIHVRGEVAAPGVYISWWFRPVGVLLYAVGAWLAFSAPRGAMRSLIAVLLGAWAIQQVALLGLSVHVAGMIAGFAGVLIAVVVRKVFRGAPSLLTLNPIFRIIAPGGLGLVSIVHAGLGTWSGASLWTVALSFLSVAIGMTFGVALIEWAVPRLGRRTTLSL